jgi:hypothetical protein
MNERIAKLYDQAIIIEDGGDYVCGELDPEKFAELIIRECAAEADKQTIYCRGIPWGRWIKEHFGVE